MNEKYLDEITIDGLDETFAANAEIDDDTPPVIMLVDFVIDGSTSMSDYQWPMCECLQHFKMAIIDSKQADEMLISKTVFNTVILTGGYVTPEALDTSYSVDGGTRLYDTIIDRRQRMLDYMDKLRDNGTTVRACMMILSDGEDLHSRSTVSDARQAVESLLRKEVTVSFIAFGQEAFGIADSIGISKKNVLQVTNDESALRRAMEIASKSVVSASKRVSSGASGAIGSNDAGFFEI